MKKILRKSKKVIPLAVVLLTFTFGMSAEGAESFYVKDECLAKVSEVANWLIASEKHKSCLKANALAHQSIKKICTKKSEIKPRKMAALVVDIHHAHLECLEDGNI